MLFGQGTFEQAQMIEGKEADEQYTPPPCHHRVTTMQPTLLWWQVRRRCRSEHQGGARCDRQGPRGPEARRPLRAGRPAGVGDCAVCIGHISPFISPFVSPGSRLRLGWILAASGRWRTATRPSPRRGSHPSSRPRSMSRRSFATRPRRRRREAATAAPASTYSRRQRRQRR